MITLAIMKPGRARSGRRYFRGYDTRGTAYWLMEIEGTGAKRWELRADLGGSMAAPDGPARIARASSVTAMIEGADDGQAR